MIFDRISYKAVVSNGLVLDKDGNKMSKRLGNAVNPFEAISQYGSDPLRWYMIANSSPWDDLKYDPAGVTEVGRKLFATLYNTYSFFAQYANVDNFSVDTPQVPLAERPEIDRWIISKLNSLIIAVDEALDDYEPTKAARAINDFVLYNLSNWYVRLNRKRFWGGGMSQDKLAAYQTLYTCLLTIARLIARFRLSMPTVCTATSHILKVSPRVKPQFTSTLIPRPIKPLLMRNLNSAWILHRSSHPWCFRSVAKSISRFASRSLQS